MEQIQQYDIDQEERLEGKRANHDCSILGVFMAMMRNDGNFRDNSETNTLKERWTTLGAPIAVEDLRKTDRTCAFGGYLPKRLRDWATGGCFTPDFRYALDAEQEKQALEAIEDYGKRFVELNEDIDAWASGK